MKTSVLRFRDLRADEVEIRAAQVGDGWAQLLLYKDARCDQNILDEAVGPMGWQRSHTRDNANCVVSLWDEFKNQWVSKEDTGTESNTEKEKGLASDSFKRACFNWGIGRELYSAPTIFINVQTEKDGNRYKLPKKFRMRVSEMEVKEKRIIKLVIVDGNNKTLFTWKSDNYDQIATLAEPVQAKPAPAVSATPVSKPAPVVQHPAEYEPIFLGEDDDYVEPEPQCSPEELLASMYAPPVKVWPPESRDVSQRSPEDGTTRKAYSAPSDNQPAPAPSKAAPAGKSKFIRRS